MTYFKLLLAFASTGLVSFVLFYLLLKEQDTDSVAVIENKDKEGMKQFKKDLKSKDWSVKRMMMSKWVDFGGGFYGVVAVLTYVVVEFREVVDFMTSEETVMATLAALGVGDVVNFFINSLMNFITAIAWPAYWINKVEGHSVWVWFVVVYLGYLTGQFFAKNVVNPYEQKN